MAVYPKTEKWRKQKLSIPQSSISLPVGRLSDLITRFLINVYTLRISKTLPYHQFISNPSAEGCVFIMPNLGIKLPQALVKAILLRLPWALLLDG